MFRILKHSFHANCGKYVLRDKKATGRLTAIFVPIRKPAQVRERVINVDQSELSILSPRWLRTGFRIQDSGSVEVSSSFFKTTYWIFQEHKLRQRVVTSLQRSVALHL